MGLKLVWEKPEVAPEVQNLLKKESKRKKKPEPPVEWGTRDRFIVGGILLVCAFGAAYFWYKGQGQNFGSLLDNASLPKVEFEAPEFGETIILEK
jgi:hypothetical protein